MTFLACLKLDYIMIENFECDHVKQVSLNSKDSVIFHSVVCSFFFFMTQVISHSYEKQRKRGTPHEPPHPMVNQRKFG